MIRERDKHRERGRGAGKCVSEHWVTLLLNLSTSKVSPQRWGLDGWGQGVVRGKVSEGRVREKGEGLYTSVQSEVRRLGQESTRRSETRIEWPKNLICICFVQVGKEHEKLYWKDCFFKTAKVIITRTLTAQLRLTLPNKNVAQNTRHCNNWLRLLKNVVLWQFNQFLTRKIELIELI